MMALMVRAQHDVCDGSHMGVVCSREVKEHTLYIYFSMTFTFHVLHCALTIIHLVDSVAPPLISCICCMCMCIPIIYPACGSGNPGGCADEVRIHGAGRGDERRDADPAALPGRQLRGHEGQVPDAHGEGFWTVTV